MKLERKTIDQHRNDILTQIITGLMCVSPIVQIGLLYPLKQRT